MTRKQLPNEPIDSLYPGDELRIVLLDGSVGICRLLEIKNDGCALWLVVIEGKMQLQFRVCDIRRVQRISKRERPGTEVIEAVMAGKR